MKRNVITMQSPRSAIAYSPGPSLSGRAKEQALAASLLLILRRRRLRPSGRRVDPLHNGPLQARVVANPLRSAGELDQLPPEAKQKVPGPLASGLVKPFGAQEVVVQVPPRVARQRAAVAVCEVLFVFSPDKILTPRGADDSATRLCPALAQICRTTVRLDDEKLTAGIANATAGMISATVIDARVDTDDDFKYELSAVCAALAGE